MSLESIPQSEWQQKLQADRQSLEQIGHQLMELAGHLNAAQYRFLILLAEWDCRKGWNDGSTQSCAHWLNWRCGIDMGAAREKVRTAHALKNLPMIAAAMLAQGAAALKGGDRHQIVIHVDAETLRDSTTGRCQFEHGPSISAETARRLACDSSVVPIVENEQGEPLSVGRKSRSIPPAIQRALNARDRGCCRFPGCPNTQYLDGHHIQHWAHGGETKLANLVSLCKFHHRQVHEGRVAVQVLDDDAIRFVTPTGESFDSILPDHTQPLGDWHELVATHEQEGLHIDGRSATTRRDGPSCDYSLAIEVLLHQWRGRAATAEEILMASGRR